MSRDFILTKTMKFQFMDELEVHKDLIMSKVYILNENVNQRQHLHIIAKIF